MGDDPDRLVRLATWFYAGVAAVALAWSAIFGLDPLGPATPPAASLLYGLLLGLGIVLACRLGHGLFEPVRAASRFLARFLGPVGTRQAAWLALLSGFAEELLFRGALWDHLGLVGTSVFFGLCHAVPVRALAGYPVFAFFAGLAFGLLREQSGSIWPAVLAHTTVNAINLAWLGGLEDAPLPPEPAEPRPAPPRELPPPVAEPDLFETFPVTVWRYDLRLELRGTDRGNLPQCLEHEELGLFRYARREQVGEELRSGLFVFACSLRDPLPSFAHDLATLSAYLFQPVTGLEVAERHVDETTSDDVRAWKVVAQRGEWVKVPVAVIEREPGRFVVEPDREDTEILAAHWETYPRWFCDAMRFKYPHLRDL